MMSLNKFQPVDIGIVTAISIEYDTISKSLNFKDEPPVYVPDAPLHRKCFFNGYNIVVALSEDKGSICSLLTTIDLIKTWNPTVIFLMGVAGGHGNDVSVGRVVFAKQIIGYEYSKIIDKKVKNAPRYYESAEEGSLRNIALELPDSVHLGIVASGSKVVASKDFKSKLEDIHRDICCLEMEGEGVAAACKHQKPPVPFIFLKGISDLGDSETKGEKSRDKKLEDDKRQIRATEASVSAFKEILALERFRIVFPPKSQEIINGNIRKEKVSIPPPMSREREFIEETNNSSIKINGFDTHAQLFPRYLWDVSRKEYLFLDDTEHENTISLRLSNEPIADNLIDQLLNELKERIDKNDPNYEQYQNVYTKLTSEGSNPYPRLLGIPKIISSRIGNISKMLLVDLAPSRYGIALIQEKGFDDLPTVAHFKQTHILNSLAVRIALIHEDKFKIKYCEFHKRGEDNSTYKGAWDVGAAGYIDPQKHLDPENNEHISPWQAAAHELSEELNISRQMLPYRDKYYFFGIGRNIPTGQIDLLGYCHCPFTIPKNRECSTLVSEYGCAKLNPESMVAFIRSKKYWVPTAILTLVMTLEAFGYTKESIYRAFSSLDGEVDFMP